MKRIDLHKYLDFLKLLNKYDNFYQKYSHDGKLMLETYSPIILPDGCENSAEFYLFYLPKKMFNYKVDVYSADGEVSEIHLIYHKQGDDGEWYSAQKIRKPSESIHIRKLFKDRKYSKHLNELSKFKELVSYIIFEKEK